MISETLKKQVDTLKDVYFRGHKIPIKNEKLRLTILSSRGSFNTNQSKIIYSIVLILFVGLLVIEVELELERSDSFDGKMGVYDKFFICCNDAIKNIRDELSSLHVCLFQFLVIIVRLLTLCCWISLRNTNQQRWKEKNII